MRTTVSILLVLNFAVAYAQQHGIFSDRVQRITAKSETDSLLYEDDRVYMLQLKDKSSYASLINQGVKVLQRVTDDYVIVENLHHKFSGIENHVRTSSKVNYLWKLSPEMNDLDFSGYDLRLIIKISNEHVAFLKRSIQGVKFINNYGSVIEVEVDHSRALRRLILCPDVIYIGKESMNASVESRVLDHNLNPNFINKVHHLHPGIDGSEVSISIKENMFDFDDIDLVGRGFHSAVESGVRDNHATDMATIVAGAGNSFITGRGVARRAALTSSTFEDLFADTDAEYQSSNVHLQNHSYGTIVENFYGTLAESYDLSANRNPSLVHVFSAGNQGATAPPTGVYAGLTGFANLTGNSKAAKNIIVVGSVDTVGRPVAFSSRGPVSDGRIKPEVVAYSMAGSSNSAALVSGVVALLQQEYKAQTGQFPASALVKSLLINSARDVYHEGPDFVTGFGNVDAIRTLRNLQEQNFFSGMVSSGDDKVFELTVPANAVNLKVTLCWNDPAAIANSGVALVNDLDLTMSQGAVVHLPWILNTTATPSALGSVATRGEDHRNNVEQITVSSPQAGTYEIVVSSENVVSAQQFFIAYQWDLDGEFEWMYPTGSDHFPYNGETGTYFYWKSTLPSQTGRLEYSTNDGATWTLIKDQADLSKGFYRWDLSGFPDDVLSKVIARMATSSGTFDTEAFTISNVWFPEVGFNCGESVMLQWNSLENATHYKVYTMGDQFMTEVQTITDTVFFINKSDFTSPFFAIEPMMADGKPGLRTSAVNYNALGGCYIRSFIESVNPDEGVLLSLDVGTTIGIERILIEKEGTNGFASLQQFQDVSTTSFEVLDQDPFQGLNRYRARLLLSSGAEVLSDTLEIFFITESPYVLFPNPLKRADELRVFSNLIEIQPAVFELYEASGAPAFITSLSSDREYLQLDLPPGSYYYVIRSVRGKFRGKIFIY